MRLFVLTCAIYSSLLLLNLSLSQLTQIIRSYVEENPLFLWPVRSSCRRWRFLLSIVVATVTAAVVRIAYN